MAQLDDLYTALKNADAAGDTAGAQKLATYIQTVVPQLQAQSQSRHAAIANQINNDPISQGARDFPTSGGTIMNGIAAYGKAVPDFVQGVGQRLGLVDQSTVDESKRLNAPLMATTVGKVGNTLGNIALGVGGGAALSAAAPALPMIAQATALGGAMGAAEPTATGESALKNTAIGAGLGGASVLGGQLAGAGYRGVKAVLEPFTEAGAQRIAGRTIQRFAENPSSIANVTNKPTITGALPTLAEQTGDVGLARLQDSLRSVDPQINNALATRASSNNAARVNALDTMAGKNGARDFAVANRDATAEQLYGAARAKGIDPTAITPEMQANVASLQARMPDEVLEKARTLAKINGTPMDNSTSLDGLHWTKKALDSLISTAKTKGDGDMARAYSGLQSDLLAGIDKMSPDYAAARGVYSAMSKPVNQMDIAATLAKKGLSKGSDLSGNQTINRNALLGALQDEPALIRQATGGNFGNSLSDVMEPQQLNMLRAIASESDRAGAVATAGNGPGSATAQRLASQNILRQTISPNGGGGGIGQKIGQAVVDNTLANTLVGKATNWLYSGIAEPKIQQQLLKAVLSPEDAQAAIAAAQQKGIQLPNNLLTRLVGQARRVTGVSSAPATRQP